MASRQVNHLRAKSLAHLQSLVPPDVPLLVCYDEGRQFKFRVYTADGRHYFIGRYEVVHAWIAGYLTRHIGNHTFRFSGGDINPSATS